ATLWYAWGMLLMTWDSHRWLLHILFPLSLWVVASYVAIVRFLSYLDLRIRREGWELELMLRSAAVHALGPVA
ncbi:MAG: hypothetical protein KDA60_00655, partial [Planctomycetales bacterium]|nr:hypothetical protein [Planctomycetales bacterium]